METEFVAILQKLVAEQGKETLINTVKCKALLSDYTRGEYKKESRLLLQALDAGVQKAIDSAENIVICKKQQIRALSEDYSLSEERAAEVVDTLALILQGDTSRTEIQSERSPQTVAAQPQQPVPKNDVQLKIGDIITFGSYKWRVLDARGVEALIITEDAIDKRTYNEKSTDVTWETCDLRKYLNNEFLLKFTKEQQGRIIEKRITNPDNLWYGTKGGKDTSDKIFLLSLEEVDRYFGDSGDYQNKLTEASNSDRFSNNHNWSRVAKFGSGACWWWLRSPGDRSSRAAFVFDYGSVRVAGGLLTIPPLGVRPALWLRV